MLMKNVDNNVPNMSNTFVLSPTIWYEGVSVTFELMTPKRAQEILDLYNTRNRSLSKSIANDYAEFMKEGKWMLNGDTIRFDVDNILMDGQKRLQACVDANFSYVALVVRHLKKEVMPTIDGPQRRSVGDAIAVIAKNIGKRYAHSQSTKAAAAAGWILKMKKDAILKRKMISTTEATDFWLDHQELVDRSIQVSSVAQTLLSPGLGAGFHYLFAEKDQELADNLFEAIGEGVNITKDTPIFHLRNQLIANKGAKDKLDSVEIAARLVRTWNHLREGTTTNKLRGTYGKGPNRIFPEIV